MSTADDIDDERLLTHGELAVTGRILPASNATFLAEVSLAGRVARCVYKPVAGERPLWDFPDGTLARRERAAYLLSEALGWRVVPLTVLRGGPVGEGAAQLWCDPDPDQDAVDLVPEGGVPPGYRHVLDAYDADDRPVSLVHENTAPLRRMAVFDVLANNADRKGGHILPVPDGHRYGVDHGVCFHAEHKLRTVLWGWAGDPLLPEHRAAIECLLGDDPPWAELPELLTAQEVRALRKRCARLLGHGIMPSPSGSWPAIPWPAF